MNINSMRMAAKLWLAVAALIVALLGVIGVTAYRLVQVQAQADRIYKESAQRVDVAEAWMGLTQTNAARTLALVLSREAVIEAAFKDSIAATSAKISELQKQIAGISKTPADKAQMEKIADSRKQTLDLRGKAMSLKKEGKFAEAEQLVKTQYEAAVAVYLGHLDDFVKLQKRENEELQQQVGETRAWTLQVAAACLAAIVVGILLGARSLIRSIVVPLNEANRIAARIAEGDLSQQVRVDRSDEFGDLLKVLDTMNRFLANMVSKVRHSTDSIALASSEIAAGNNDLSLRTEQTSGNLQQSASALDNLTHTVQHSAASAQQASGLAASASAVAERGGAVVQQVVSTMEDINTSSKRIADIIGVIDGIAFQTNILALNAAVEAARAGEQGRGFAVVAGEVRSLAQRSAAAAKEIKTLINASVERVENGTRLVSDAGNTMTDIVTSVRRVTDMIGEITAASNEQSAGIAEVNQAVSSLDQMTQQNAALVEQSAAAAQSLREQADQLAQVVSTFRVGGAAAPASSAVPRPVATPVAAPLRGSAPAVARAATPALKPAPEATPRIAAAPKAAPKSAAGAESDWESF